jgi:23S rRNA (cytosine1962-C5)-methyltransferase
MYNEKFKMFENRLLKVFKHRKKTADRQQISCFRIYDHDLPEFPFIIDYYEGHLYVCEYVRKHTMHQDEYEYWLENCLQIMHIITDVSMEQIYYRLRQRKQDRLSQYQKVANNQNTLIVKEAGLNFKVNLADYLDTGLFLDHRITRLEVQKLALNKNVLNLFAYTGSFSVYAKAGGALKVTTVDLSNTYLNWAKENMELNNFNAADYEFIKEDALAWLKHQPMPIYDIIICDPPTFSNSKSMAKDYFEVQEHHEKLLLDCAKWLNKDGIIFFSTNYTKFYMQQSLKQKFIIKDITKRTIPFDFEAKLQRFCFTLQLI